MRNQSRGAGEVNEAEAQAWSPKKDLAYRTSVIVVAHNSSHWLEKCIRSIRSTEPNVEIVLVDNASIDQATDHVSGAFPEVKLVRSPTNLGFGGGNNLGVTHATRELFVFLNPDATVLKGWLEAMVAPLLKDTSVGLITPKVLLRSDPYGINVAGLDVHLSGLSMCRGLEAPSTAFDQQEEVAAISGVAFATRRDVYEALGGFDPDFFLYMEDVDLSFRAWLSGYVCIYVPIACAVHEYKFQLDPRKTFYVERGRYLTMLKCLRWRSLIALVPVLILTEVITWGWVLLMRPRAVPQKLLAYWWVMRHYGQTVRKRRLLQNESQLEDTEILEHLSWMIDFTQLAGSYVSKLSMVLFKPLLWIASYPARLLSRNTLDL